MKQQPNAHNNNFDFLRLLFASFVIFTHAFALLGHLKSDPFYTLSHRVLSEVGVCGFFSISGYLIHQSLERSSSWLSFIRKRAIRIFPGLAVAVLFSALVLGLAVTTLPRATYLGQKNTWLYIADNLLLIPRHLTLPGVFEHNFEPAVNGSLWTLRYEVFFYVLLSLLFRASAAVKKVVLPLLFLLLLTGYILIHYRWISLPDNWFKFLLYIGNLGSYFMGGALLSLYSGWVQQNKKTLLLLSGIVFVSSLCIWQRQLEIPGLIAFPVMVITSGLHYTPALQFSRYTGDISYGTYIYAYPLQQALIVWLQPQGAWVLMLASFPLAWVAGLLSWHFVEKRFLKRKPLATP